MFDGGCVDGIVGCGFTLDGKRVGFNKWIRICAAGTKQKQHSGSSDIAECCAAGMLLAAVADVLEFQHVDFSSPCKNIPRGSNAKLLMAAIDKLATRNVAM